MEVRQNMISFLSLLRTKEDWALIPKYLFCSPVSIFHFSFLLITKEESK